MQNLDLNLKDNLTMISPFILGTVINGGFKRKLRMLRSDFFSLLSIIHSQSYVKTECLKDAINVKKGVVKITQKSQNIVFDGFEEKVKGWNKPLYQKLNENYLTDVTVIN